MSQGKYCTAQGPRQLSEPRCSATPTRIDSKIITLSLLPSFLLSSSPGLHPAFISQQERKERKRKSGGGLGTRLITAPSMRPTWCTRSLMLSSPSRANRWKVWHNMPCKFSLSHPKKPDPEPPPPPFPPPSPTSPPPLLLSPPLSFPPPPSCFIKSSLLFFRRVRITFRQEERTELIVCDRKGQSLGTKVAIDCCKTVACTVVDVCMSAAVVEPFTDGLQERRMQRSSMMLLVEAERSSRSRRESQRICNSSVS